MKSSISKKMNRQIDAFKNPSGLNLTFKHDSIVTKIQMVSNKTTGKNNLNEEIKWILKSLQGSKIAKAQRKGS